MEIFDREIGGGLLLAIYAIKDGWQVILGGKASIFPNLSRFKKMPGVFFLKSIVPGEIHVQKNILKYGHKITSLDVEGLVPSNGEAGVRLRYSEESIQVTDYLFFWGIKHYESVYNIYPIIKNKSIISGSPIIDDIMLKNNYRNKIKLKKLKKILIGTSCGYSNHISGKDYSKRMTENAIGNNIDPSELKKINNEVILDEIIFHFWKDFIPELSNKFPDTKIIVRPHPSEDKEFWEKYLKSCDNIKVNKIGSINDQMVDVDAFIHFNSTTTIASRIFGIPTFMVLPDIEESLYDRITYVKDYSINITSVEEFSNIIDYETDKLNKLYLKNDFSEYFINNNITNFNSSELMLQSFNNHFEFIDIEGQLNRIELKEYLRNKKNIIRYRIFWFLRIVLEKFIIINSYIIPKNPLTRIKKYKNNLPPRNSYKYSEAKQPNIPTKSIHKLINNYNNDLDIDIKKISKNLFLLKQRYNNR